MEDDAMELDDTARGAQIIEHKTNEETDGKKSEDEKKPEEKELDEKTDDVVEGPSKSSDVVVLDDDDEPPAKKQETDYDPEEIKTVEVIDLVEKSINSKCINYACKSGKGLISAPNLCLAHYRVKSSGKSYKEVCAECYENSFKQYGILANELKCGNLLSNVDVPLRNDMFEIEDSDEETEEKENDGIEMTDENLDFFIHNIVGTLSTTMEKLNFNARIENESHFLKNKERKIEESLTSLSKMLKDTRKALDNVQINLYNEFRADSKEESVLTILDDHNNVRCPIIQFESNKLPGQIQAIPSPIQAARKSQRTAAKKIASYNELDDRFKSTRSTTQQAPVPTVLAVPDPSDLPQMGDIERPPFVMNDIYYITRENSTGSWIKARYKGKSEENPALFKLHELKQLKRREVDGKQIAYFQASRIRLEIGTRVIALFTEMDEEKKNVRHELFYPGIVAEPPVDKNRFRYLVFFDIGYSQYVNYKKVYMIFEASANVWEDMPPNSREFIKKYLETNDRPMVKLQKGHTVRVEYNGRWVACTVKSVDCSLVLVQFDGLNRLEWIYRGSSRLSPMYKEEQNASKRQHTGGRTTNKKDEQIVQYTKASDFGTGIRAVARKSTARPESADAPHVVRFLPQVNNTNIIAPIEPTSKIMYFTPRDQVITQRLYKPHNCSPACKDYVRHNLNKLRGHNPLSKPLLCGWARLTVKVKGKRDIVYKAPCSRILRNMAEIHKYLRKTKSAMTVDLFDFNHIVRCLAEFNVECIPNPKDLSKGAEQVPVPVINGINSDMLNFSNYLTKRVPMEEVPLNTNPEFLCGCDCTDDCVDKTKCACWRLTLEGAKYQGKNIDPNQVGYIYRRLHEQVLTGIYECNSRCKCSSTCLNRVVQNPMSIKLQVFKTHNRGWGIRCVNDVPQGTFICIYAGTIHSEQRANEDGQEFGDEYFAELDYIENCERHKEDYEAEVVEPESPPRTRSTSPEVDDDDDDSNKSKRKEDNDFNPGHIIRPESESFMRLRQRYQNDDKDKNNPITISDDEDDPKEVLNFNPTSISDLDEPKLIHPSVRRFFGEDEPYVMDTKNTGNIGRFLNHSCSPNVFVQNVFVDTHDLRFPWVAFFCSQFIRAGTELTWNYNYDIGSVPDRILYCHCGSLECKGRLL